MTEPISRLVFDGTLPHDYQIEVAEWVQPSEFPAGCKYRGCVRIAVSARNARWDRAFEPGLDGMNGVLASPSHDAVFVVSAGKGYLIPVDDPDHPQDCGEAVQQVLISRAPALLLCATFCDVRAIGPEGNRWQSKRLALDGMRRLRVVDGQLLGDGSTPAGRWRGFRVDLRTGSATFEAA